MAEPDEALKAQLASWFASVDPAMQQVLKDIYAEAPAAVSKAISGGAWEAATDDPPLDEVLGGGAEGAFVLSEYTVDPWPITPGANVKVTMQFFSGAGQPGFRTDVKIIDPTGNETNQTLNGDAIQPGGGATQEFTIESAVQGQYQIAIHVNPDGAPPGEPPNASGSQILLPGMGFAVESAAAGADTQDSAAFSSGLSYLVPLTGEPNWARARDGIPDAVNYLASIDGLAAEESAVLGSLGTKVPRYVSDEGPSISNLAELLTAIGVAAQQAVASPTGGAPEQLAEARKPVFDALTALDAAI